MDPSPYYIVFECVLGLAVLVGAWLATSDGSRK